MDIYFLTILSSYDKNTFNQSKNSSEFSTSKLSFDWWKEKQMIGFFVVQSYEGATERKYMFSAKPLQIK